MILSVITVRKGSQGLKNKCIRKINGVSVFEYVVKYSLELNKKMKGNVFTVVSTDSEIIIKYCKKNNIPFIKRSKELASNIARLEDVIYDAYCRIGKNFEYISLLYGNIPTRYSDEFLKAYSFLKKNKDYDCVLSMQNVEKFNPAWMFELNEKILPIKRNIPYRRQDLKQLMIHDGHTILFRTKHFSEYMSKKQKKTIMYEAFGRRIKPMINNKLIIDIDTEKDLKLAAVAINL